MDLWAVVFRPSGSGHQGKATLSCRTPLFLEDWYMSAWWRGWRACHIQQMSSQMCDWKHKSIQAPVSDFICKVVVYCLFLRNGCVRCNMWTGLKLLRQLLAYVQNRLLDKMDQWSDPAAYFLCSSDTKGGGELQFYPCICKVPSHSQHGDPIVFSEQVISFIQESRNKRPQFPWLWTG